MYLTVAQPAQAALHQRAQAASSATSARTTRQDSPWWRKRHGGRRRRPADQAGTATKEAPTTTIGSAQMEAAFNCSTGSSAAPEARDPSKCSTARGAWSMDEPKKRLLNSLRTEPGVFSGYTSPRRGRRRGAQHPRLSGLDLLFSSTSSLRTTRPSTNCARRAWASMRPSPSCCGVGAHGMNDGMKALLLNAAFALLIVFGTLAAYDQMVVRPAQRVGVVDVGEVYRQKEAEFTQILTKPFRVRGRARRRRTRWHAPSPSACRSPWKSCRGNAAAWWCQGAPLPGRRRARWT